MTRLTPDFRNNGKARAQDAEAAKLKSEAAIYEAEMIRADEDAAARWRKILDDGDADAANKRLPLEAAMRVIKSKHEKCGLPSYLTSPVTPPEWFGEKNLAEKELNRVRSTLEYRPALAAKVAKAWGSRKPGELWCDIGHRFGLTGNEAMVQYEGWHARMLGTIGADARYCVPLEANRHPPEGGPECH